VQTVAKADTPSETAGTVDVELAAGPDAATGKEPEPANRTYGDDFDIYLNDIETQMIVKGAQ
jgi:hypothetical protein